MRRWRVALVEYVDAETRESAVGEAIALMSRKWQGAEMPSGWVATEEGPAESFGGHWWGGNPHAVEGPGHFPEDVEP